MPRAKPFDVWEPGWLVPPFQPVLKKAETREAIDTMLRAAGLQSGTRASGRFLSDVRSVLEQYRGAKPVLDHAPRPANQRAALARIDDGDPDSRAPLPLLKQAIDLLDARTRDALQQVPPGGFDLGRLRELLDDLDRAITIVDRRIEAEEKQGKPSRGAEPREARRLVLQLLAQTFQSACIVEDDEYPEQLRDFLESACRLGGIDLPRKDRVLDLLPSSVKVPRTAP